MRIHWIHPLACTAMLAVGFLSPSAHGLGPQPQVVEVPFRLHRDYIIVVEGTIGGLRKKNLLIDTGAVPSVIDSRLVGKLKLKGKRESLSGFTGTAYGERVRVPDFELGPIRLAHVDAIAQDLRFIERELGVRIDALIGLDVLGWSNFAIDYEARKLLFGAQIPDHEGIQWELGPGCMLLPVWIGERRLRLMVDTGAHHLMFFETRFRDRFKQLPPTRKKTLTNITGSADLREVDLPNVSIGETRLGPRPALLIPVAGKAIPGFDGLLGLRSLGIDRVFFDFNRRLLSLETDQEPRRKDRRAGVNQSPRETSG